MYERVKEYIEKNRMLEGIERVVVGLSGGADSVCLLFMLYRYIRECREKEGRSIKLTAVHVHHGIRGVQADNDADYSRRLCGDMGIEYRQYSYDVPRIARERGMGEEETGRLLRYQAFRENAGDDGLGVIAVAHHQNDQAETVLFHLARGSYVSGVSGMRPTADGIIRPLLCISRSDIENWLDINNIQYCTDNTNFDDNYARNAIRLKVIPYLEEHVNGRVVANICRYADGMSQVNDYIGEQTRLACSRYVEQEDTDGPVTVNERLLYEHTVICRSVIYDILKKMCGARDLEDKHVMSCIGLFDKQCGRQINLPKSVTVRRTYGGIVFENMSNTKPVAVNNSRIVSTVIECDAHAVDENVHFDELINSIIDKNLMNDNCTKFFDYGKIKKYIAEYAAGETITMRHRAEGDYMVTGYHEPEHTAFTKKLKEVFIESKIPAQKREEVWLCAIGSRVLWAAGVRRCAEFLVDKDTKALLKLELASEKR